MKSKFVKKNKSTLSRKRKSSLTDEEIVEDFVFRLKMRKQIREKDWKKNQYKKKKVKKTSFQLLVENMKEIKSNDRVIGYEYKSTHSKIKRSKRKRIVINEGWVGSEYKIEYGVKFVSKRHQSYQEQKKKDNLKREIEKKKRLEEGHTIPQDTKKRLSSFDKLTLSPLYEKYHSETYEQWIEVLKEKQKKDNS